MLVWLDDSLSDFFRPTIFFDFWLLSGIMLSLFAFLSKHIGPWSDFTIWEC